MRRLRPDPQGTRIEWALNLVQTVLDAALTP